MKFSLLLGFVSVLHAFAPGAGAASPEASGETPPAIDREALNRLRRMSNTLSAAKAFTFRSKGIIEVAAATGQFLTFYSTGNVALVRPNKLRAMLGGDAPPYEFYYDGAKVTAYAPATNVYSSADAPGTIDEMLRGLREETGIRIPTAPLFFTDPYSVLTRDLRTAVVVGPSTIDGATCDHLAFRSPGVNWEIWIESNSRALPRRLAVTFIDQPNFPRTLVEFSSWNLHPWLPDTAFDFTPPKDATRIPFGAVAKAAGRR